MPVIARAAEEEPSRLERLERLADEVRGLIEDDSVVIVRVDLDHPHPRLVVSVDGVDGDDAVSLGVFDGLVNFHCEVKPGSGTVPLARLTEPPKAAAKVVELLGKRIATHTVLQ
jgi:hypothetical protein